MGQGGSSQENIYEYVALSQDKVRSSLIDVTKKIIDVIKKSKGHRREAANYVLGEAFDMMDGESSDHRNLDGVSEKRQRAAEESRIKQLKDARNGKNVQASSVMGRARTPGTSPQNTQERRVMNDIAQLGQTEI